MIDLYRELKTGTMELVPLKKGSASQSAGSNRDNFAVTLHFEYSSDVSDYSKYIIFDATDRNGTPYWYSTESNPPFDGETFTIPYSVMTRANNNTLKYQLVLIRPINTEDDSAGTQVAHSAIDSLTIWPTFEHELEDTIEETMSVSSVVKWWLDQKLVTVEFKKDDEGQKIGTVVITTRPDSPNFKKEVEINLDEIFATDSDVDRLKQVLYGQDGVDDYTSEVGLTDRVNTLEGASDLLTGRVDKLEEKLDTHIVDIPVTLDGNKWSKYDSNGEEYGDGMYRQTVESLGIYEADAIRCSWTELLPWKLDLRLEEIGRGYNESGVLTGWARFAITPLTEADGTIISKYSNMQVKLLMINIKRDSE